MLPEDVQALLGGILFFFMMSIFLLSQKVKASSDHLIFSDYPVKVVRFLK